MIFLGKTADEMVASGAKPLDVFNRILHDAAILDRGRKPDEERRKDPSYFLSLGGLPAFTYTRLETGAVLVRAAPEIAYLLLLNLILFLVAFMRFVHYDVR